MVAFTEHFQEHELTCKCGCGMLPQKDFMKKVETLRKMCGFPFIVSSAARCPSHNSKVSSSGREGPHTTGRAIDISVDKGKAVDVMAAALASGLFTGFGVSQKGNGRFIHLDDLALPKYPRPNIWSY